MRALTDTRSGSHHDAEALQELTRVVAHLAAQLTMTQLRLRGLATYLESQHQVEPEIVRAHIVRIADAEAGFYLRENLGERLARLIDVEQLTRDIVEFVSSAD